MLINAADENEGTARVSVDDEAAAERALNHLASLGHERIGMILGPEGHVPSARKLGAYVRHMRTLPDDQSWRDLVVHVPFSMEDGGAAMTRLLGARRDRRRVRERRPGARARSAPPGAAVWRCPGTCPLSASTTAPTCRWSRRR